MKQTLMRDVVKADGSFECRACGRIVYPGDATTKVFVERPDLAAFLERPNPAIVHTKCFDKDGFRNQYRKLTDEEYVTEMVTRRLLE